MWVAYDYSGLYIYVVTVAYIWLQWIRYGYISLRNIIMVIVSYILLHKVTYRFHGLYKVTYGYSVVHMVTSG